MPDVNPDSLAEAARQGREPAELSAPQRVLWLASAGEWEAAHDLAQGMAGEVGARLHAYLHRVEGDLPNARYWYRRAGVDPFEGALEAEWRALAVELSGEE